MPILCLCNRAVLFFFFFSVVQRVRAVCSALLSACVHLLFASVCVCVSVSLSIWLCARARVILMPFAQSHNRIGSSELPASALFSK